MTPRTLTACLCIIAALALPQCVSAPRAPDTIPDIGSICDGAIAVCTESGDRRVCEAALACVNAGETAGKLKRMLDACSAHADVDAQVCRRKVFSLTQRVGTLERERWYWIGAVVLEAIVIVLLSVLR